MADEPKKDVTAKKTINILKILLRTGVEVLFAAAFLWVLFILASRYFCKAALENLGRKTETKITADAMHIKLNGYVEIDALTIRPGRKDQYDETILKAQKTNVRLSLPSLFLLKPRLKRISINDFTIKIVYDSNNGRWNLPLFEQKFPKGGVDEMPTVHLSNGVFSYSKITGKNENIIAEIPFQGMLIPQNEPISRILKRGEKVFNFELAAEQWSNIGAIRLSGTIQQGRIEIKGSMLPANSKQDFSLQAESIKAILNYSTSPITGHQQDVNYAITIDVNGLKSGQAAFAEHFAKIRSFSTEPALGERFQAFLDKSQVKGRLDAEFRITGSLKRIMESKIIGKVYCKDIFFCDKSFEYPIEALSGNIDVTETSADLKNLQGRHKDSVIFINGWTKDFREENKYQINITSDSILLDKDVYSALNPSEKKIWDDFSPTGTVSINYALAKESATKKAGILKVTAKNCQAVWNRLAYPLKNVTGNLAFKQDQAELSQLVSINGTEKITIDGKIEAEEPNKTSFDISLKAENIEPNSILQQIAWADLSQLIRIKKPAIIDSIRLGGRINLLGRFKKDFGDNQCDYDIKIECLNNIFEYSKLPFQFKEVSGNISIHNDHIRLEKLKATADNVGLASAKSLVKIDGEIKLADSKFDSAELRFEANDIALDERLGTILPQKIRSLYFKLKPTGLFDLNLNRLKIFDSNDGNRYIEAAVTINLNRCNFDTQPRLTELQGRLAIQGMYKSGEDFRDGKIKAQDVNLRVREKLLTGLNADIVYYRQDKKWYSDNLTADCYGGKMGGKLEFNEKDEKASYLLDLGFDGIDLQKFLSDPVHNGTDANAAVVSSEKKGNGSDYTSGKMNASLSILGQIGEESDSIGRCRLNIRNMEVGKVSLIGKLLYILRLTEPRDFTFERMVVDSYLRGNKLLLNVDLSGIATAFQGDGILELKSMNIDLLLNARGRRPASEGPGPLQTLTEGLGQGIVQIKVKGNVNDPKIETVAFPVIRETMGLFGTKEKSIKK
jgi:hypothetical protein